MSYYVDDLARNVVPLVVDDFVVQLRALGIDLPLDARPIRFGSWVGRQRPDEALADLLGRWREHHRLQRLQGQLGVRYSSLSVGGSRSATATVISSSATFRPARNAAPSRDRPRSANHRFDRVEVR